MSGQVERASHEQHRALAAELEERVSDRTAALGRSSRVTGATRLPSSCRWTPSSGSGMRRCKTGG
jgi:hypothetical protein